MDKRHIALLLALVAAVGLLMAGGAIADGDVGTQDETDFCSSSADGDFGTNDLDNGDPDSGSKTETETEMPDGGC